MSEEVNDLIGRDEIVDKICNLVDNLQKDKHFCLALNGDWGSGKSFVVNMIEKKLLEHNEYLIIKYDAWKNNFYSDPLIAILACMIDGINDKLGYLERFTKSRAIEIGKEVAEGVVNVASVAEKRFEALKNVFGNIKAVFKQVKDPLSNDEVGKFKSYQSLLLQVQNAFNDYTQYKLWRGKQTKLIILVDEIDRCLPDEQMLVLERLHHLFEIKNCAVICALNKKVIANSFEKNYGCDGNEYLRKFFDFTYKLEMKEYDLLQQLLSHDLFNTIKVFFKVETKVDEEKFQEIIDQCLVLFCNYLNSNHIDNRRIIRYYESLLNVCFNFKLEYLYGDFLFFIIVGLFVEKFIFPNILVDEIEDRGSNLKFIGRYFGVNFSYDDFYEIYRYYSGSPSIYPTFDSMIRELNKEGRLKFSVDKEMSIQDSAKLKDLMLIYGGQDDVEK